LENKLKGTVLKDKEAKKFEKIQKQRVVKAKEAKKKAELLSETIKEKQKAKRAVERELVQNSIKQFREAVKVDMGRETQAAAVRSTSAPKKLEENTATQELYEDIYDTVRQFYEQYDEESEVIRQRLEAKVASKLKKLDKLSHRAHSAPRGNKADELANAYIQKIKKYDSSKALKEMKHLKAVVAKDKQFREVIKNKRKQILELNRERQAGRKENLTINEERAQKVLKNRAELLTKVMTTAEKETEKVANHLDKVQETHEGLVG
jgi:hypothetical protein